MGEGFVKEGIGMENKSIPVRVKIVYDGCLDGDTYLTDRESAKIFCGALQEGKEFAKFGFIGDEDNFFIIRSDLVRYVNVEPLEPLEKRD
jgi:hypothetical protein